MAKKIEQLLMKQDAAQVIKCGPATVNKMVKDGRLTVAATTPRGCRLFSSDEVARAAKEYADQKAKARLP